MLDCPASPNAIAPAMVKKVWMSLPATIHIRLCASTRSPIRPMNPPRLELIKEHKVR